MIALAQLGDKFPENLKKAHTLYKSGIELISEPEATQKTPEEGDKNVEGNHPSPTPSRGETKEELIIMNTATDTQSVPAKPTSNVSNNVDANSAEKAAFDLAARAIAAIERLSETESKKAEQAESVQLRLDRLQEKVEAIGGERTIQFEIANKESVRKARFEAVGALVCGVGAGTAVAFIPATRPASVDIVWASIMGMLGGSMLGSLGAKVTQKV